MKIISENLSRKVLTLSAEYSEPKGGIAQVVNTYSGMYPIFNHVATVNSGLFPKKVLIVIVAILKFLYFCLFKDIRIVHIHGASNNSFRRKRVFIYIAKIMRKRIVYHIHGAEYKEFYLRNSSSVESVFSKVDVVVALSESWRLFFEGQAGHSKVRVIENVVSPPVYSMFESDGLVHFLFLGELGKRKGVYDLLEAISEIRSTLANKAKFHIGGNGEVKEIERRIQQLDLEGLVTFEGWVSGEKKIQLLSLADVYILPSYNEGLPVSILEAMSYRLPIISTPVGGIPEVVKQGENGFLIKPGDKSAIAEAILVMTMNEDFRRAAGENSYSKVQPHFPDSVAKKLEEMYSELLD